MMTVENMLYAVQERLKQLWSDIDPHTIDRFEDKAVKKALREIDRKVKEAVTQLDGFLRELRKAKPVAKKAPAKKAEKKK